jgi:hypothetical protein
VKLCTLCGAGQPRDAKDHDATCPRCGQKALRDAWAHVPDAHRAYVVAYHGGAVHAGQGAPVSYGILEDRARDAYLAGYNSVHEMES